MAIRFQKRFSTFLLLSTLISFSIADLLCKKLLTAILPGSLEGGIFRSWDGTLYEEGYYEKFNQSHFRVCICEKKPCVRKCCQRNYGYVTQGKPCQDVGFELEPEIYEFRNEKIVLAPNNNPKSFYRFYGNACDGSIFQLYPEETPYLLENGSVAVESEDGIVMYGASEFCFSNSIDMNNTEVKTLRGFGCIPPSATEIGTKNAVYAIATLISIPFLFATLIVYSLPELRNLHGKNLMSEVAALLLAYISLIMTQYGSNTISDSLCIACAFIIQYAFLATFFWLNVMCFDMWSTFSRFGKSTGPVKQKERKKFILYSCYAWGCPAAIVMVTIAIEFSSNMPEFIIKPEMGSISCYFSTPLATIVYFYTPMGVVTVCNIILFVLTAIKIYKVRKETKVLKQRENRKNHEAGKQRFNLYLKLFLVMGISWSAEIISYVVGGPEETWYFTDIINSLQGLLIFWIFVCNQKIKKVLISKFCPQLLSGETDTNTSSFKVSMSGAASSHSMQLGNRTGLSSATSLND